MTGPEMQNIMEAAHIRLGEAAEIFRVSNATVKRWYAGEKRIRQIVVFDLATKMVKLVERAVAMHLLPVKQGTVGRQRRVEITNALRHAAVAGIEVKEAPQE